MIRGDVLGRSASLALDVICRAVPPRMDVPLAKDGVIRLYWWADRPNFGDVLSRDVVRYVSGLDVEHAPLSHCEMIAVGSVYPWLKLNLRRRARIVHVWGSGMLRSREGLRADSRLRVHALRGPLTAWTAGVAGVSLEIRDFSPAGPIQSPGARRPSGPRSFCIGNRWTGSPVI